MNLKRLLSVIVVLLVAYATPVLAQDKQVTGKVTDAKDGSTLPGATVKAKGTKIVTQTGNDGVFKIKVPTSTTTLVVSYSGFTEREIAINGDIVNVKLEASTGNLNEVVVVGYGTQRKRDVSASITKISEKDLNPGPVTSPLQQIAGKAAGVQITQVGNEPGVAPNIRIRGITSLSGGNDPLIVVDGIQGGTDLLNQLSPNEIESIEVLKDASATAIYGSRGAAGVLLVTTKRSKAGQTFVEYSGSVALESIPKFYENLNATEWRSAATARGLNMGNIDFGGNTDWVREVTRNGTTQNHNIAFGGGTGNLNYRASLTAIMQQGVITKSAFDNNLCKKR
jgi:iron complex outermembrane receptor protein